MPTGIIAAVAVHLILGSGIVAGWSAWNRRTEPRWEEIGSGRITPGKISAFLVVALGLAMAAIGVALIVAGTVDAGTPALILGLILAVFMAPSLTTLHDVCWDSSGVEGVSRLFGPTLGLSRTRIAWADIVRIGKTVTSYWYVEARDGRRIYWSYLYPGHGALWQQLRARRPEVAVGDAPPAVY